MHGDSFLLARHHFSASSFSIAKCVHCEILIISQILHTLFALPLDTMFFFPWNALSWWATYHLSFGTEFQYVSSSAWSLLALQAVLSPLSVLTDYNPLVFYCDSWLSYMPPLLTMSSLRTEMSIIHPVFPRLRRTDGVT